MVNARLILPDPACLNLISIAVSDYLRLGNLQRNEDSTVCSGDQEDQGQGASSGKGLRADGDSVQSPKVAQGIAW
jgi:hypothetical protein